MQLKVDMKAVRVVVQASVMVGCYDLQCTCSDVCTLQPYCTLTPRMMSNSVDMDGQYMDAAGHGMRDLERPRP
jgi:hypothetical protein